MRRRDEKIMKANTSSAAARGQVISYQEKVDALSVVTNLPKNKALELLQEISGKQAILTAVYEYWVDKRKRVKKPILRRLQPPPAPNDTNPFNVFRPREKISRLQTRRRRENDVSSYDKLRQIRKSVDISIGILELVRSCERRKSELLAVEQELQNLQINLRHEPKSAHEAIEQKAMDADKKRIKTETPEVQPNKNVALAGGAVELIKKPDGQYVVLGDDTGDIAGRKRRREIGLAAIGGYPPLAPEFKSRCCRTSRRRFRTSKCCSPNLRLWARCDRSCYRSVSISRTVVRVTVALVASSSI